MEGTRAGVGGMQHSECEVRLEELQQQQQNGDSESQQQQYQESQNDDFLDQMLSTIPNCSWPPTPHHDLPSPSSNNPNLTLKPGESHSHSPPDDHPRYPFDDPSLVSKLRQQQQHQHQQQQQMTAKSLLLQHQQQFLLSRRSPGDAPPVPGMLPLPLTLGSTDSVDPSSFKSQVGAEASVQALYNGFVGSIHANAQPPPSNQQHFHPPPPPPPPQGGNLGGGQNFGAGMNQAPPASASTGGSSGAGAPQRQRVRARRGQATDPHSIAERLRRERIAERMKGLQELVPNANKTDKASMLDEIIDYVKFLQLQVKVLSMSRLGGAAAVAPLVAASEGGGGVGRSSNGNQPAPANDSMTITEHQVAKLMEEDMGSAMQYLQGKGLCLMPISLATAISTATSLSRTPLPPTRPHINNNGNHHHDINNNNGNHHHHDMNHHPLIPPLPSEGDNNGNGMSMTKANPSPDSMVKDPSN